MSLLLQNFKIIAMAFVIHFGMDQARATIVAPDSAPISHKSLKIVRVPEPININEFVKNKPAAIRLGKALFWEMRVGSDGIQSCASCHFHAGVDNRAKNNVTPGLLQPDTSFQIPGPNGTVQAVHFPLTSFQIPDQEGFERNPENHFVNNTNDAMSSQGVRHFDFVDIIERRGTTLEKGISIFDPVFNVERKNVRRVEPRHSPTVINAVFNFTSFWDGRARNIFNGVNAFGELDEHAKVFIQGRAGLEAVQVRIPDASLASQAVMPPVSDFEMSFRGRTFPKIGKKLLALKPLGLQRVHRKDSVLGFLAHENKGLKTSYAKMIQAAFHKKWWSNNDRIVKFVPTPNRFHPGDSNDPRAFRLDAGDPQIMKRSGRFLSSDEFSQIEANFSLFFGLAVQLYEATLVSDDSKWDRVQEGRATFTTNEQAGSAIFNGGGRCAGCHQAPEFTRHSVRNTRSGLLPIAPGFLPNNAILFMNVANRDDVIYDGGIYNLGVRPAGSNIPGDPGFVPDTEDVGRGATAPLINPLTGQAYPTSFARLAKLKAQNLLPPGVATFVPDLPVNATLTNEVAVDGAQKAPILRNIELTGPYFHNGDAATLRQVVEFYTRGGNFPETNAFNLDAGIRLIPELSGNELLQKQLVAFLKTLTDERVRNEEAPFDHPELFVPNGSPGDEKKLDCKGRQRGKAGRDFSSCDDFIKVHAVGAGGRKAEGLLPLDTFLGLDPETP